MKFKKIPENSVNPITVLCIIETLGRGGGAEQLVASLAQPLLARDIQLEFVDLFSWPDDLGEDLEKLGFVVHRLKLSRPWNLIKGMHCLRSIVAKRKPMIVWGHLYFGNLYASLLGLCFRNLKSVITLHSTGLAQITPSGVKGRLSFTLEKWLTSHATHKVAVSYAVRDVYRTRREWEDIHIIHNGIDIGTIPTSLSVDEYKCIRQQFNVSDEDFVIVVPARFVPEKGHSVLIEAVSYLADQYANYPKFLLIGQHTPLVVTLDLQRHHSGILNGQLQFLPPVPQGELYKLFVCSNAVVVPSVQEAFGMVAVEALATEVPVILSRVGGMAEIDPHEKSVIYVPPGDPLALGDAIATLMRESGVRIKADRRGRSLASERFSLDRCADSWQQLFISTLSLPRFH